jgi:CRP/FNR family transcriptional regulator, cyclic AMP receptor protein
MSIGERMRLQQLGRAPPFDSFPLEELKRLAEAAAVRMVRRGVVVFHAGDPPDAAYVLERGAVRIASTASNGRWLVFRLAGRGECFGLSSALAGTPRSAEARAITSARVLVVPVHALGPCLERSASAATACARYVAERVRSERERIASATVGDTCSRLALALRQLGEAHGVVTAGGRLIDLPLRHEDLAGLVGSTRETVTRAMAVLAARGFLRRVGERYVVLDDAAMASSTGA